MTVPTNQTNAVVTITRKNHMSPTKGPKAKSAADSPTVATRALLFLLSSIVLWC
jgi:hypothetical protein